MRVRARALVTDLRPPSYLLFTSCLDLLWRLPFPCCHTPAVASSGLLTEIVMLRQQKEMPQVHDRMLSIDDVSRWLGVSNSTTRRLVRVGDLPPSVRVGRLRRWRRSTLENWAKDREEVFDVN